MPSYTISLRHEIEATCEEDAYRTLIDMLGNQELSDSSMFDIERVCTPEDYPEWLSRMVCINGLIEPKHKKKGR
jgi:hypothetical protein